VKHTLGRLGAAFELWSQGVDIGATKKRGETLIKQAGEEWDSICRLPGGSHVESLAGADIEQLEALCTEFVTGKRAQQPGHEAWFHLGLEIVRLRPTKEYGRPPGKRKRKDSKQIWDWKKPERIAALLGQVEVSEDQLLPELQPDDPVLGELPKHWQDTPEKIGWLHIEAGLKTLQATTGATAPNRRPSYDRDHQFLEWYNDKSSDTHHSPKQVRNRWNEMNPTRKVTIEVVKTGLKKARNEPPKK